MTRAASDLQRSERQSAGEGGKVPMQRTGSRKDGKPPFGRFPRFTLDEDTREWDVVAAQLSPELQELLRGYQHCDSPAAAVRWQRDVVRALLERSEFFKRRYFLQGVRKAYCPLCEGGSQTSNDGFSYPDGLRRHLTGKGQINKCIIMSTVLRLAQERWQTRHDQVADSGKT